jgi:hypothetical protein
MTPGKATAIRERYNTLHNEVFMLENDISGAIEAENERMNAAYLTAALRKIGRIWGAAADLQHALLGDYAEERK